jgi:hypothetical protein
MSQPTFDSLIRQPKTVRKSRGGVVAEPAPWLETSPFISIVLDGVRRRFRAHQRPQYQGVRKLDRRPEFTDLVIARSKGLDVRERDSFDDWSGEADLDATVAEFLEFLDGQK